MPLREGATIVNGKYRIRELIGQGGMARVWLAEEMTFGNRRVVIKEPRSDLAPDELQEVQLRYQREVRVCAELEQTGVPNIVHALTAEPYDDGVLLVMQYMPGGDLTSLLEEHPQGLPIERAIQITLEVLQALRGAHEHHLEIVHRDVKPSNILFDKEGHAYLGDFGLAQVSGGSGDLTKLLGRGPVGTPMYAAPEQLQGKGYLTPAADLYAVGCVLFEMLTGKRYKRVRPGTRPSELRKGVPAWLDSVVLKAVAEDPYARWQSAAEMAQALRERKEVALEEPEGAREAAPAPPEPPKGRKQRSLMTWVGVVTVMSVFIAIFVGPRLLRGGGPEASPTAGPTAVARTPIEITDVEAAALAPTATLASTWTPTPTPNATATAAFATAEAYRRAQTRTPTPTFTHTPTLTPTPTPNATATAAFHIARAVATAEALGIDPGDVYINPKDEAIYVYIPPGEFTMGSPEGEGDGDEHPQHRVYLDGFWIMLTEVTNAQYARCVEAGACTPPDNGRWKDPQYADHPVTDVTWFQANEYARWVGARLPTEAEWEKAARGIDGRRYPWGDEWDDRKANTSEGGLGRTTPVGSYPAGASPYGVLDMAGNVWEWTSSLYEPYPYRADDGRENPEMPGRRVVRGGSWYDNQRSARTADRGRDVPDYRYIHPGFSVGGGRPPGVVGFWVLGCWMLMGGVGGATPPHTRTRRPEYPEDVDEGATHLCPSQDCADGGYRAGRGHLMYPLSRCVAPHQGHQHIEGDDPRARRPEYREDCLSLPDFGVSGRTSFCRRGEGMMGQDLFISGGLGVAVWCWRPDGRKVDIPQGYKALLVRGGRLERVLSEGRHKVRGFFGRRPELYLYSTGSVPLFLWLTHLSTADGRPVGLSWHLRVTIADPHRFWEAWLRDQKTDRIPLPEEWINERLADPVQELVQRYSLSDLRTINDVRERLGGKVSLELKRHLDHFGLEIAEPFDFQRMRFVSDRTLAEAQRERETIRRMLEDERLQTLINRIDNLEALEYRIREWLVQRDRQLREEVLNFLVTQWATVPPAPAAPPRRGAGFAASLLIGGILGALAVLIGMWYLVSSRSPLSLTGDSISQTQMVTTDTKAATTSETGEGTVLPVSSQPAAALTSTLSTSSPEVMAFSGETDEVAAATVGSHPAGTLTTTQGPSPEVTIPLVRETAPEQPASPPQPKAGAAVGLTETSPMSSARAGNPEYVRIPSGTVVLDSSAGSVDEQPQHRVNVRASGSCERR
ncbi:MAG: hypothetical protein Kow0047_23980 [Anaerolineae bacterium]